MSVSSYPPLSDFPGEQALVGELLRNSAALNAVGELCPFHFSDEIHGKLFQIIATRVHVGHPADLETMMEDLSVCDFLEEVGGAAYVDQLAKMPPVADIAAASERLQDLWRRRSLLPVFLQMQECAEEGRLNALGATSRASGRDHAQHVAARLAELFANCAAIIGPPLPRQFADGPGNAIRNVAMLVLELEEFADFHEVTAAIAEQAGDHASAQIRRNRAERFRALIGEAR